MFWQIIGFLISMITQIAGAFLSWRIADNLTFGGILFGLLLSTVLIATIRAVAGMNELSTNNTYQALARNKEMNKAGRFKLKDK